MKKKSWRMRQAGQVMHMGEMKNSYKIVLKFMKGVVLENHIGR
jgi:hypothetical protein